MKYDANQKRGGKKGRSAQTPSDKINNELKRDISDMHDNTAGDREQPRIVMI